MAGQNHDGSVRDAIHRRDASDPERATRGRGGEVGKIMGARYGTLVRYGEIPPHLKFQT
jgi:hypothetical protein